MTTPLKDIYNQAFLEHFSTIVQRAYPAFQATDFIRAVMDDSWDDLALKARTRCIAEQLGSYLPPHYEEAISILLAIADDCTGFPYLFFPDFVAVYGQADKHVALSMQALECFTQKSSAEFAIRGFLLRDPERIMKQMMQWAQHPNEHVRRLASEGCRPRLPWGESLPMFKQQPAPVLAILAQLKEDPSLYVRKSVANNLNDISKDHPELVLALAKKWIGQNPQTDWIIRHGCRTLIKQAKPEVMAVFGYATEDNLVTQATISAPATVSIGERGALHYELTIRDGEDVYIRIEYGIDFVKANGRTSRKKFMLANKVVAGGTTLSASRLHNWADLTTRRHYPGEQRIVLLINGQEIAHTMMTLQTPKNI